MTPLGQLAVQRSWTHSTPAEEQTNELFTCYSISTILLVYFISTLKPPLVGQSFKYHAVQTNLVQTPLFLISSGDSKVSKDTKNFRWILGEMFVKI